MEIILSDKLKDYLFKNNKREIILDLPMRKVCCSGPYIPIVRFKRKKDDLKEFKLIEIDGIKIHINENIKYSRRLLEISIRKSFGFTELYCFDPDNICVCGGNIKGV